MPTDDQNKLTPAEPGRHAPLAEPIAPRPTRYADYGPGYGYGYAGARDDTRGARLREYLRVVRKNAWLILTLVVIATTVVAVAAFKVDDQYRATAQIQIEDPSRNAMVSKEGLYINLASTERYYKTQLRLLRSEDLARRVALELGLERDPDYFSGRPQTLPAAVLSLVGVEPDRRAASAAEAPPLDPLVPLDEAGLRRLRPYELSVLRNLIVEEVPSTQLVNISFQHHDPATAAKVANAVAESFVRDNLNKRVDSKAVASDFVQRRIAELQAQIRDGEERLVSYGRTHEILSLEAEKNPAVERLSELNNQVLKAEAERQALDATREAMRQAGVTDAMRWPVAQQDQGAQELSRTLAALKQRRLELSQRYTDEYPEVRKVDEQIAQVEADLERVKKRLAAEAEAQYQAAVIRERGLRELFERQRSELMQQNEDAITYRILQQEVETNKSFLKTLLERQKEIDVSAASEVNNVVLKNRASALEGPVGPDRSRWILLGVLVSLVGGLGLAFGREYLDQTVRSIEDIDRVARLPSLGVIPALEAGGKRRPRRVLPARGGGEPESTALVTSLHARSSAAEAYRQLRTSVLLSSAGHPSKLLLVTSSQPREGKTTTAVNTAISLAQTGASVVIVDCDMRRPRVHQLLNVDDRLGISLYLSGQHGDLDALVQPHQIPNLSVLPCGPIPPNPAELIGSDQMRKLLGELSSRFDHIVVDSPPVVSFADPVILSTMVDGVILVVRGGFTSRGVMLRSRQILGDVGAKIYGVVLNDADMKSNESYHYDYNNYYYGDRGASDGGRPAADA